MRHGSLFSGIGGFDLAAQWMGWQNVFHCEWNEFGQKVLKHYWPKSISYADICATDFTIHRGNIDILTGGFPCQPYSSAGKRLGKEDDRHLWPEMLRAINEIQPRWVVGENVLGLVNWSGGLVFHEVQTDLEAAGYEVFPYVLPAVSVGAPHRRDRIWFVAHSKHIRLPQCEQQGQPRCGQVLFEGVCDNGNAPNSKLCPNRLPTTGGVDMERTILEGREWREKADGFGFISTDGDDADTSDTGLQGGAVIGGVGSSRADGNQFTSGRVPPNWEEFPTQSPVCTGDDGIPDRLDSITFPKWRNESIKAAGNAIVPQVVYQIFKSIEQYEQLP